MNEIIEAAERIRPHVRRTPLLRTDFDDRLRLKAECFQLTGSFKARGAFNAVLAKRAADPSMKGVIAVSSGNHAQALALAARSSGLKAVVIIPADAKVHNVTCQFCIVDDDAACRDDRQFYPRGDRGHQCHQADETAFRLRYRVDGQSAWATPITVDTNPSMPLAPRFASTRSPSRGAIDHFVKQPEDQGCHKNRRENDGDTVADPCRPDERASHKT